MQRTARHEQQSRHNGDSNNIYVSKPSHIKLNFKTALFIVLGAA